MGRREQEARADRARMMLGVPYKHRGRDRHGLDCLGLVLHVYGLTDAEIDACVRAQEIERGYYADHDWYRTPDEAAYAHCSSMLVDGLTNWLHPTTLKRIKLGDVLLFSFKSRERRPDHAGIYLGSGRVAHADLKRGVVPDPIAGRLERRLTSIYTPEPPA